MTSGIPSPVVSISTVIVSPGSPVPVIVGVVSLVTKSSTVGASVSISIVAVLLLPVGSVAVTSSVSSSCKTGRVPLVGVAVPVSIVQLPSAAAIAS